MSSRTRHGAVVAISLGLTGCGDDAGPPDARRFDGPPPGGTVQLSWTIADDGTPLTCAQVGAALVSLTMIPTDQPFGVTDVIACSSGSGTSGEIDPGRYNVTASLTGVAANQVRFDDVDVVSGESTPLGVAAFQVDAVGGFTFRLAASSAGDNCSGAGITAVQLALATLGGTCVEATFEIAAGAGTTASTYTTSCSAPAPHTCIEEDQQVTVAPTLATGTYRMTITGMVGADACWSRVPQFDVPAGGATESLPLQQLAATGDPDCP